jgi:hypothetical protein
MDRRGFLRRAALWGGLSAALAGGGGAAFSGCGNWSDDDPPPTDPIEYEDCDADDMAEGDSDCDPSRLRRTSTPRPANTRGTTAPRTPGPVRTTKR